MPQFHGIRFVLLDRDGVINRKPPEGQYITRREQIELLPGAAEAISAMNQSGRIVIVVTNQRGIALGRMGEADLAEIHQSVRDALARRGARLDAIYYCPHDKGICDCRKPGTRMIEDAFRDFPGASSSNSLMIGDSISDVEAGRRAGMSTIFISGDPNRRKPGAKEAADVADAVVGSLLEAIELLSN